MTYIETVPDDQAAGGVAELYANAREMHGFVTNFTRAFSLRPDVYAAWLQLNGAIKSNMDLRRYELATLAAARSLRSSYCCLAHGSVLVDRFLPPEAVTALVAGLEAAGLDEADRAVMELAEQVVADATSITEADIARLRELGLGDADVLDVVLAAAARCFFSKTLDAVGVEPDARYAQLDAELRDALTVGRPIAAA